MKLTKQFFGRYKNTAVYEYTLTNENNVSLSAIPFGATITKLCVPDKEGKKENIVLTVDNLIDILNHRPFYGATVGRVAGRLSRGKFTLDGKTYQVETNENGNFIHGGSKGLDRELWQIETDEKRGKLMFTCESQAVAGGFPGTMQITVTYTLTESNDWVIDYKAVTDEPTLFNPTNHVYFNLTGDIKTSILKHQLELSSATYVPLDEEKLPSGDKISVEGTPFDFRKEKPLEQAVLSEDDQIKSLNGLDHPFILDQSKDVKGTLYDPSSGRELTFYTDRNCVVIFTHNGAVDDFTIAGESVKPYAGITLETQTLPDAINNRDFGNIIVRPGETFHSQTIYHFGIRE
ncbi:aldose epimerase family protein [Alkalibacterium kapii]|uniref:Aldose 1-epimerase n=1 Tax=Alkalibacterium kapii TaxID=426704 RepID=A0A511AQS4_9LACT|nr:aldose epimerase family protein [Alkalibacterium kapii]GEK90555.1 aldose 1-epimerase [Alkalibacterium kapii]